ncbi:methyltransferase [Bacillus cereus]|uniref:Methyltransferase n=1 Tax=Bacillus cereus TaxID=1396 RepID=A0A2B3TQ41_BACCE|nr:class I SAM-dependent methyltransferase [Bacillus cereus]PFU37172.1 methyltransferase [Bacillus cereus]
MNNFKLGSDFDNLVSPLSDAQLLNLFIQSCSQTTINGVPVPTFPPEEIQKQFVGASYEHALYEAYLFYSYIKTYAQNLSVPLNKESKVLDFGCGWGRIIRFLFKDVSDQNLLGIDVDPAMITLCNETLGRGIYKTASPQPPVEFIHDNSLDIIFAYSVFSHLSEATAENWIKEFSRILRPGGIFIATTQARYFLDFCQQFKEHPELIQTGWHKTLSQAFPDIHRAISDYESGNFVHSPTGAGDVRNSSFYGETVIPMTYIKKHYEKYLKLRDFFDDVNRLPQALFVLQKE